jgi:hypothetical protein
VARRRDQHERCVERPRELARIVGARRRKAVVGAPHEVQRCARARRRTSAAGDERDERVELRGGWMGEHAPQRVGRARRIGECAPQHRRIRCVAWPRGLARNRPAEDVLTSAEEALRG